MTQGLTGPTAEWKTPHQGVIGVSQFLQSPGHEAYCIAIRDIDSRQTFKDFVENFYSKNSVY